MSGDGFVEDGFVEDDGFVPDDGFVADEAAPVAPVDAQRSAAAPLTVPVPEQPRSDWPYGYSPDALNVPVTADFVAPSGQLTWMEQAPRLDYVTTDAYREKRDAENELLRGALVEAKKRQADKLTAFHIAQKLSLPVGEVQRNLDGFRAIAASVDADPEAFRKQAPPELVRLVLKNPQLATNLVETETGGKASNLLRGFASAVWGGIEALGSGYQGAAAETLDSPHLVKRGAAAEALLLEERKMQAIVDGKGGAPDWVPDALKTTKDEAAAWLEQHKEDRVRARKVKREVEDFQSGKTTTAKQVDDAAAQQVRAEGGVVGQRYRESEAGLEASRLRYHRMMAALGGAPQDELLDYDVRIHDLELEAQPRLLGEGQAGQLAGEATQGVASTVGMLPEMGAKAITGMTVGAVGGAILAKRAGLPLAAGARAGAMAMAGPSALLGAAESSFYVEAGSTQKELSEVRTDLGKPLNEAEVAGGALLAGALKAGLEVLEVNAVAKTFGLSRGLLSTDARKEVAGLMAKDPRFRALAARVVAQWLKSAGEEGLEEGFQTATDNAVAYLVKSIEDRELQKGPILDREDIAQSMVAGTAGGLAMGSVGSGVQLVSGALQSGASQRSGQQVKQVLQVAQWDVAEQDPAGVAQAVGEASAKSGQPVTALHVDGKAAQRFFQERAEDQAGADAQADEALGPGGAQKVAEAAATGGKVEVPLGDVMARWGKTDAAKALADDTTTHPALLTPRELAEGARAQVEAEAQRIVEEAAAKFEAETKTKEQLDGFQQQLEESLVRGEVEKGADEKGAKEKAREAARTARAVLKAFMATQAADFSTAVSELFPEAPVVVAQGDETVAGQQGRVAQSQFEDPGETLLADAERIAAQPEGMARAAYTDNLTKLLNRRGFDAVQEPGAPGVVVAMTSTDSKPINDTINHEQTNRLFRVIGSQVAAVDPQGAREGTTFFFRAESAEKAGELAAKWRRAFPKGFQLTIGTGVNSTEAAADLEDRVDAGRAKSKPTDSLTPDEQDLLREFPDAAPLPAERTATKLALASLTSPYAFGVAVERPEAQVPARVVENAGKRFATPTDFAHQEHLDAQTGSVILSARGFEAVGPRRYTVALDGIGLKALNSKYADFARRELGMGRREAKAFGRAVGDVMLKRIARTAAQLGGMGVNFARLSGDEFALKGNDRQQLRQFVADLKAELAAPSEAYTLPGGTKAQIPADVRWGDAEGTYEQADEDLKRRREEPRGASEDAGGEPDLPRSGTAADRAGRAADRGVFAPLHSRPRAANRGGAAQEGGPGRLEQDGVAPPKGYTLAPEATATARVVRVFLNRSADVSTVLHESAHAFLFLLSHLAQRPDAPQRTQDTYAAALKWLGAESFESLTRAQHEKWARSFEAYLLDGKAPSAALARAFAKAKLWLTAIYRSLRGIPEAALDDDARRVFDALLATEGEVEAMRKRQGPGLFATAKEAGVTDAQWQAQLEAQREAYDEASRKVQLQAVKDALRVHEKWWLDGLAKLRKQYAEEYEALPGRRAQRLLEEGDIALDRAAVEAVIGTARVPGLRTVAEGGVRPSQVAEAVGLPSGEVMLAALAGLQRKERWVEAQARAEMERLNPGILDDLKRLRAELADSLHDVTEKRILDEWAALKRKDPNIGAPPVEAMKRAAEKLAAMRPVGKLSPARALAQERSAANLAARAAAKGDWTAAVAAKQQQLLNAFLHAQLLAAEKDVESTEKLAARMRREASRARLGKAMPSYRDAADLILEAFFGDGDGQVGDTSALQQAVNDMNGDAVLVGDPEWLEPARKSLGKPWEALTVEEARHVRDALKNLSAAATHRNTVLLEGKRVDFEAAKAQVLEEIASTLRKRKPAVEKHARTPLERVLAFLNAADGYLSNPIDWVKDLTGDNPNAMLYRLIANTLRRAQTLETDLLAERVKPILDAFEAMPAAMRQALGDLVDSRALFPQHISTLEAPRRRFELLMLALNAGSESSLQVLLEGRGITLEQLTKALNLLTKEEIDWVNAVHASLEGLREPAFALEERESGIRPRAVEARPMQLANGTLRGGYFPLKAAPEASTVGARQAGEESLAALFDPTFTRPGTAHGHLTSRTGATYPVTLDPDVLRKHLLQVAHDIAFRETVKSVARLVMDADVRAALQERLGAKTDEFLLWLKDIGGARGLQSNAFEGLLRLFKRNLSTSALSGLSTAVGNFANLATAVASTKLKTKHLVAAMSQVTTAPLETRRAALQKSGVLRTMSSQLVEALQKELQSLGASKLRRALAWLPEAGMAAMRAVDTYVSTAVWLGAYRQAMADGKADAEAVRWADDLVLRVNPSQSLVEKSRIQRDRGWVGSLAMFYSYLNLVYRQAGRIASPLFTQAFQAASAMGKSKMAGRVAGGLFGLFLTAQVMGELGMGRGPEDGDKDDEEPDNAALAWRNWLTRKMLVAPLTLVPVVPLASMVEGGLLGKKTNVRADPFTNGLMQLTAAGKAVHSALEGGGDEERAFWQALKAVGLLTGAPTRFVETSGKYFWEVGVGERDVPNAGRFVGGAIYGERDEQPVNVPTLIGDSIDQ